MYEGRAPMSISGEKEVRASLRKSVDFKKWIATADAISRLCLVELRQSGPRLSDEEAVLLIEMVDGPWATHANIEAAIGSSRAEKFSLQIQAILNRMINAYDASNILRMEEAKNEVLRQKATGKKREFWDFLFKLRSMKWSTDDREMVRAAHWAVYG